MIDPNPRNRPSLPEVRSKLLDLEPHFGTGHEITEHSLKGIYHYLEPLNITDQDLKDDLNEMEKKLFDG